VAHLQGFDHATKAEERVMWAYAARLSDEAWSRNKPKRVRVSSRPRRRA
jgi:hypothetical protein